MTFRTTDATPEVEITTIYGGAGSRASLHLGDLVAIRRSSILEIQTADGACVASGDDVDNYLGAGEQECWLREDLGWHVLPPRRYQMRVVKAVLVAVPYYALLDVVFARLVHRP